MVRSALAIVIVVTAGCRPEPGPARAYHFAHHIDDATADYDEARFRSFRKDSRLTSIVTLGTPGEITESRVSLVPPVPSSLTFDVDVPLDGQLDFEIGVASLGSDALPAPVVFRVLIDGDVAFEDVVRRRFGDTWFRGRVDVSPWSGNDVSMTFETTFRDTPFTESSELAATVMPAWGNPVLGGHEGAGAAPDLILISIDCLRADHVGVYGHERPTTPALDAFARDGIVFENVASVSSWTLPTHMSMLTGLMPTEHGLSRAKKRSPSVLYLPELLSREGYETLGVVSGLYLSPTFGFEQGFDVYRSLIDEPAEALVDAASELLLAEPRRPRFLFLHLFDAHWRYLPPEEYLERMGGRPPDISKLLNIVIQEKAPDGPDEIAQMNTLYDAELAYIDEQLGRFFDELKARGRYDDSLIVVTADHGEGFYEHELWQHSEIIYNEVTRVPLIVKPPQSSTGARVSELVSQLGIFPTFLETIGRETPYDHAGLIALSEGRASFPSAAMSEITWEATETRGPFVILAATEGKLKYIATFAGELEDEEFVSRLVNEELYDLADDPGEQENLLPDGVSRVGKLRSQVRDYLDVLRARRSQNAGDRIVVDEAIEEKLRAVGYIQ